MAFADRGAARRRRAIKNLVAKSPTKQMCILTRLTGLKAIPMIKATAAKPKNRHRASGRNEDYDPRSFSEESFDRLWKCLDQLSSRSSSNLADEGRHQRGRQSILRAVRPSNKLVALPADYYMYKVGSSSFRVLGRLFY